MGPNMPVSAMVCETAVKCSSAIRDSLASSSSAPNGNGSSIHSQILTSTKLAFLGTVEYEESPPGFRNNVTDSLKSKYTVLSTNNPLLPVVNQHNTTATTTMGNSASSTNGSSAGSASGSPSVKNGSPQIPTPKMVLYDRELVQIGWKNGRKWSVGTGMSNVGNTCYLNSTLQALFHVPAFANWLYSDDEHRQSCENNKCIICAMAKTLKDTQDSPNQSIKPYFVYSKLRDVCKHLVPGDQEDAHEFLRYLVEAMEKAYLMRYKNSKEFDQYTKETTPLNQILGGYLKSSVRCLSCEHVSVTFQHFQDLLLDIRKSTSIEEALDIHFARERLEDMGYKCESCKRKVSATKQFSMERPPITLCIQLKRFSMMGGKINKHISFGARLNLSKYSARKSGDDRQMIYRLVSVVTHLGSSQHCGHYTAVGLTQNGNYYNFDDSSVRQIPIQNVLQSNAYIIFYELEDPTAMATSKPAPKLNCTNTSKTMDQNNGGPKPFIGPVIPQHTKTEPKANGTETTTKPSLVLNISNTNTTNKTWNNSKLVTTPLKLNGFATQATPATNGSLHQSTTGLTPDITNKLKVTNGNQSNGVPNKKSDTNSYTATTTTLNGKSSLPSMPKLDIPAVNTSVNQKLPTPSLSATKNPFNGNSTRTPPSSPKDTPATPVALSHNKLVNGSPKVVNGFTKVNVQRPLVPYDDDSSDCANQSEDDSSKSPPMVKTKAGLFHVTSTLPSNGADGSGHNSSTANSSLSTLSPTSSNGSTTSSSGVVKKFAARPAEPDNTLSKLMKNSHKGFGAPVMTWGGQNSRMELELKAEKQEEAERKREIDADADMDRGRQKKIKFKHNFNGDVANPGYNPFNERQINLNANPRCSPHFQHGRNNNFKQRNNNHRC